MRTCLLMAALLIGLGGLAGCSDDKTTPAANSDPLPGEPVSTAKGAGRIPPPVPPR